VRRFKIDTGIKKRENIVKNILKQRIITILCAIIILAAILITLFQDDFLSLPNLTATFGSIAFDAITAYGMTLLLAGGLIDISVGSIMSFVGASTAAIMHYGSVGVLSSIFIGLVIAIAIGTANGLIVGKVGVNPLITTIAMMGGLKGAAILVVGENRATISGLPEMFGRIGQYRIFNFQLHFWIMIGLLVVLQYLLSKSRFFRKYYYMGSNQSAAEVSGININNMKVIAFILSALFAGLSGILFASRLAAGTADLGDGAELRVITAALIGGASLSGGRGTILGTFLGVVFMALVRNFLILAEIPVYWYDVVVSSVLLVAVILISVPIGTKN
jgi:ribose transport system permease protein